jgi:hypothetical protein
VLTRGQVDRNSAGDRGNGGQATDRGCPRLDLRPAGSSSVKYLQRLFHYSLRLLSASTAGCGKPARFERNHGASCALDDATEGLAIAARWRVAARNPEARCNMWPRADGMQWHARAGRIESAGSAYKRSCSPNKFSRHWRKFPTSRIRSRIGVSRWRAGRIGKVCRRGRKASSNKSKNLIGHGFHPGRN